MHGQSTLPDGRVVVTFSGRTYIYKPNTNTWEEMATVPTSFSQHGQSTLNDGRVLVSGHGQTYVYTLNDNAWTEVASFPASVLSYGQSTLLDGRVLISGGYDGGKNEVLQTVYMYNIINNTWESMATLPVMTYAHTQSTLINGEVLIGGGANSGGWIDGDYYNTSYVYIPNATNGSWVSTASMPVGFRYHAQSTLMDGRIIVSGGVANYPNSINDVRIYTSNAGINSWVIASPMPTSFWGHRQSTLADGRVLVTGGTDNWTSFISLNTAYIYTPTGWVALRHRKRSYFAYQYIHLRSIHPV